MAKTIIFPWVLGAKMEFCGFHFLSDQISRMLRMLMSDQIFHLLETATESPGGKPEMTYIGALIIHLLPTY